MILIYGKKKQYDYDDIFFTDEKRIKQLEIELQHLSDGFTDEDDIIAVDHAKDDLRGDGTLGIKQIHLISIEFARVLYNTFRLTPFAGDFNTLYNNSKSLNLDSILTIQQFTDDTISKLKDILTQKGNLPYREGKGFGLTQMLDYLDVEKVRNQDHSNLYEDVIELALEWFRFVKETLYNING